MDETYSKFEGGIAVVIVVAFVMMGLTFLTSTGPSAPTPVSHTQTSTLYPASNGTAQEWSAAPCSTDASSWNELNEHTFPGDGDTTCRQANVTAAKGFKQLTVHMDALPVPDGGTVTNISSVTVAAMVKRVSGDDAILSNASVCSSDDGGPLCVTLTMTGSFGGCVAEEIGHITSSVYVYASKTFVTCGGGAHAWNETNLAAMGLGFECYNLNGSAEKCRASQGTFNVTFSYTTLTPSPDYSLSLLLPLVLVAVAVVFVVAYIAKVRGHE